jgi:hypothetical protein
LPQKDESRPRVPKVNLSVKKKIMAGRAAKLKKSAWYEGAARSVGIRKEKPPGTREGAG